VQQVDELADGPIRPVEHLVPREVCDVGIGRLCWKVPELGLPGVMGVMGVMGKDMGA
jgi:hypothetical protein